MNHGDATIHNIEKQNPLLNDAMVYCGRIHQTISLLLQYYKLQQWEQSNDEYIILTNNALTVECKFDGPFNHLLKGSFGFCEGIVGFQIVC